MDKNIKRLFRALLFAFTVCVSLSLGSCSVRGGEGEYSYRTYTGALATNWNPHTWEQNGDREVLEYILPPLVDVSVLNSGDGSYQWVFEMASYVKDVTAENRDKLTSFSVKLPEGADYGSVSEGFVFEIGLNERAVWEGGEPITADDYVESMRELLNPKMKNYRANLYYSGESAIAGASDYYSGAVGDFSSVGLYKLDDYRLIYITENAIDLNYFLSSLSSNWLVHIPTYNAAKRTVGELLTTSYNTGVETTVSAGPYRLASVQTEKQMTLERNEDWYGWEKTEDGRLVSYTPFEVDGEVREQYKTTRIVIDVMDDTTARSAFLRGELSVWTPSADELKAYGFSDRLNKVDQTYTMSLFFNTNGTALEKMDRTRGNKNSRVLTSDGFRRAFSLSINRARLCTALGGAKPQYALLSGIYYYDIYNDPASVYRNTPEAMAAICKLYGISWGEGTDYPTLSSAYRAINGYNLRLARSLMKSACDELVASGIYKRGEEIRISMAWSKGALTADDNKQITLLSGFINAAAEGSGFGKITLVGIGNVANRYAAVPSGDYAIGYGAWGGAAFYPFRNLQVYMDPDKYSIHEAACYDPKTERLTLTVGGERVTKTWQEWSGSLIGSGAYSGADMQTKLSILADLEREFLSRYYRIPLMSTTECTLLSYQLEHYTARHNVMYGFGGIRLMEYNLDDAGWREFVRDMGGTLDYE